MSRCTPPAARGRSRRRLRVRQCVFGGRGRGREGAGALSVDAHAIHPLPRLQEKRERASSAGTRTQNLSLRRRMHYPIVLLRTGKKSDDSRPSWFGGNKNFRVAQFDPVTCGAATGAVPREIFALSKHDFLAALVEGKRRRGLAFLCFLHSLPLFLVSDAPRCGALVLRPPRHGRLYARVRERGQGRRRGDRSRERADANATLQFAPRLFPQRDPHLHRRRRRERQPTDSGGGNTAAATPAARPPARPRLGRPPPADAGGVDGRPGTGRVRQRARGACRAGRPGGDGRHRRGTPSEGRR